MQLYLKSKLENLLSKCLGNLGSEIHELKINQKRVEGSGYYVDNET